MYINSYYLLNKYKINKRSNGKLNDSTNRDSEVSLLKFQKCVLWQQNIVKLRQLRFQIANLWKIVVFSFLQGNVDEALERNGILEAWGRHKLHGEKSSQFFSRFPNVLCSYWKDALSYRATGHLWCSSFQIKPFSSLANITPLKVVQRSLYNTLPLFSNCPLFCKVVN